MTNKFIARFIHEGSLTPECIQKLTRSFTLTPQFWDYYGTASVINSVSAMIVPEGETPTDGMLLLLVLEFHLLY